MTLYIAHKYKIKIKIIPPAIKSVLRFTRLYIYVVCILVRSYTLLPCVCLPDGLDNWNGWNGWNDFRCGPHFEAIWSETPPYYFPPPVSVGVVLHRVRSFVHRRTRIISTSRKGKRKERGAGKGGRGWRKMENGCEEKRVLPMGPPRHGFCHSKYTQKRSPPLHPNLRVFSPFYEFEHTKAGKYNIGKGGAWIIFSERRNFARLCLHKI